MVRFPGRSFAFLLVTQLVVRAFPRVRHMLGGVSEADGFGEEGALSEVR